MLLSINTDRNSSSLNLLPRPHAIFRLCLQLYIILNRPQQHISACNYCLFNFLYIVFWLNVELSLLTIIHTFDNLIQCHMSQSHLMSILLRK